MKMPLRFFLVICLVLGAVAIPVGWRTYQKWKADEIEALEEKLKGLYAKQPFKLRRSGGLPVAKSQRAAGPTPEWQKWRALVEPVEDRIQELTGRRPTRPQPRVPPPSRMLSP